MSRRDEARRGATSPRTFYRWLRAATGTTPLQWLLDQRLARARRLLESTGLPIAKVGELSGLGTADNLRHHFLRQLGVSGRLPAGLSPCGERLIACPCPVPE
ncbi:helix-turn-helix domain-containing protein [Planomonospora sp. ID67723]|uniref:helix-turn-helix domain-containing protein n=1 Tax=Planomonospora sp. ID67723 TaxID=2738134 RepID=UPI001E3ED225|nr:helix-turn-helix domain-containing protein [Planomonospora sp. ID67723]